VFGFVNKSTLSYNLLGDKEEEGERLGQNHVTTKMRSTEMSTNGRTPFRTISTLL
jgi:hypothetical protein